MGADPVLADRVRRLIGEHQGIRPDRLRSGSRLEEDLGITGDDAAEFLEAFAAEFGVDLTGLEFHKHFGPECGPLLIPPRWLEEALKDFGRYPVTVGHLVDVARAGRWTCPPPAGSGDWPELPPPGLWDAELDG